MDTPDHGLLVRRELLPGQQLCLAQHQIEGIADLVTDLRKEVALGPVGSLGPFPGLARVALLGQDLDAADEERHGDGVTDHQGDPNPAFNLPGPREIGHVDQGQIAGAHLVECGEEGGFRDPGDTVAVDVP